MKIQPYIEKLEASEEYKKFQQEHPEAFLIAGFFIIDFETHKNLNQIDYYIPSEKKVAAFTLDDKVTLQMLKMSDDKKPEELDIRTNIDLDSLQGIVEDGMKNRSMSEEIKKMIAVIQTLEGKKIWSVNCVLSGMELLKAHIDDKSEMILKMEKSSIMDYIKKMPKLPAQQQKAKVNEKDVDKEMEKLEKIKKELKKQMDEYDKNKDFKKNSE